MKKAFVQLHIAVFLAGFTAILGHLISLNESLIVWYRLLFTALTMWVLYTLGSKLVAISFIDKLKIAGVGFIAALHWITFYGAIKYANVSVALICFSSISFFTALLEPVILRQPLKWLEMILGLFTLLGIYIIFHFDGQYKSGIILGIISAVLAAIFPIYNREFLKRINVETLLVWQQTGALIVLSFALPIYLHSFPAAQLLPTTADIIWLLVLSWICSVAAFQLSSNALKRLSAFTVNLTYNLEPVYGILLAFALFNENKFLSNWFYLGFAIIAAVLVIHVLILLRKEKKITFSAS